jgi:hypothetical protein
LVSTLHEKRPIVRVRASTESNDFIENSIKVKK